MQIASHNSQHDAAEDLPLVSDAATITGIEPMDRVRREEVIDAVELLLEVYNEKEYLDDVDGANNLDWDRLRDVLIPDTDDAEGENRGVLATKLDTLQDRYERDHPMLVSLRFQTDDSLQFVPGQYVTLRYDGTSRPYSIASSPNSDETELCVQRVPDGTLTPTLCETLDEGDTISIRGPSGDFVLADPSERDLVFSATGTGIAPFKSMIDYTFEEEHHLFEDEPRDIWLFLGGAWEDDLPYRDAFRDLDETYEQFHFVPTLTRETYLSLWKGENAYVQQTMMKYFDTETVDSSALDEDLRMYLDEEPRLDIDAQLDPNSMEVYACGINTMIHDLTEALEAVGVPEANISAEGYGQTESETNEG